VTQVVCAVGNRSLTAESSGDSAGTPIFLLHGTPGSRSGPKPRASILYRLGVRLISYDRPGYGASGRLAGREVADAAGDVAAIADELGLAEFGIVGRSGGGPHALACAALLPDRVRSAAVLVGLAPADADDLGWYDGMTSANERDYRAATTGGPEALTEFMENAKRVQADPETLLHTLMPDLTDHDRRVVNEVTIRRQLMEAYAEALRAGAHGWLDDVIALRKPWGFDPSAIKQPVLLWHGADDAFVPVDHAVWLADRIASAQIEVASGTAHFGAVETLPKALTWVKQAFLRMAADSPCSSAGVLNSIP